jgi:hypothetical protein
MKVAKHFIAAPPTDQADDICINVGTKQGHGPGGAKGTCRDITGGKKTEGGAQESNGGFECAGGNVGRRDITMPTPTVKVAGNGGREVSVMFSRVKDTVAAKADDRAQLGIAGASEANNFTTHTVLLRRKRECGEHGGTEDVGISSKEKVEAAVADPKLDFTEAKGGGLAWGNHVFTRAKEIEESDAANVSAMARLPGIWGSMCAGHDATEDLDWNRFDAIRGRVFLLVGGEHALDAKIDIAIGG